MKFKAAVNIMPHDVLLDPQGKAVKEGLKNLDIRTVDNVRVGKHITLEIDAPNRSEAERITREACEKLLANKIMEFFEFELTEMQEA